MDNWKPGSVIHVAIDWDAFREQWPDGLRSFHLIISQPSEDSIEINPYVRVEVNSGMIGEYNVWPQEIRFEERA